MLVRTGNQLVSGGERAGHRRRAGVRCAVGGRTLQRCQRWVCSEPVNVRPLGGTGRRPHVLCAAGMGPRPGSGAVARRWPPGGPPTPGPTPSPGEDPASLVCC
jgi:hypothetical protein